MHVCSPNPFLLKTHLLSFTHKFGEHHLLSRTLVTSLDEGFLVVFWGAPCVPSVNHAREKAAQLASSRTTVLAVRLGYEISDELILVGLKPCPPLPQRQSVAVVVPPPEKPVLRCRATTASPCCTREPTQLIYPSAFPGWFNCPADLLHLSADTWLAFSLKGLNGTKTWVSTNDQAVGTSKSITPTWTY